MCRLGFRILVKHMELTDGSTDVPYPDSGGADSWGPRNPPDAEGNPTTPTEYTTETPCTEAFHTQAQAMMADAAMLHAAVTADYAARWPDLTAPTLAECEAFVSKAKIIEPPAQELPE